MYIGTKYGTQSKILAHLLKNAQKLDYNQITSEQIRKQTGWFRGKYDQKWRYEITEQIRLPSFDRNRIFVVPLVDIVYDQTFFKAYPRAKFYAVTFCLVRKLKDFEAVFYPPDSGCQYHHTIVVKARTIEEIYTTFVHELQHLIQYFERFARGGDWKEFKGTERQQLIQYNRLAGEIECRDVESRLEKTYMVRQKIKPFSTDRCRSVIIWYN